jgi:HD superfamily phosphohydrolase
MSIVIREPIWGDIEFTALEAAIIGTRQMQRLRWIKQLGTGSIPYPSANHTRFEHSIGTCHVAGRIFDAAAKNAHDPRIRFTDSDRRFVRLLGLLHDVSHIAFGHILEDELRLFGDETHDTEQRLTEFISPIAEDPAVKQALGHKHPERFFRRIISTLASEPDDISKPYLLEMVKDTVCADLLDYLARDYRFLGISRVYDERIYRYFSVAEHKGKPHLVVQLTENGRRADDSLTEMENLLRIRYTLAERVFYHETKLGIDALLDKALYHSNVLSDRRVIDWLGDEGLLLYLKSLDPDCPISVRLADRIRYREHYVPAYMVTFDKRGKFVKWKNYMEPPGRRKAEQQIINAATLRGHTLDYEDVVVFCPQWEMNMKAANVLVRGENDDIRALKDRTDSQADKINERHMQLWRFYVYCPAQWAAAVAEASQDVFGCDNEYVP